MHFDKIDLTEETTTSNNNTSNESGGVTVSPQAIEKVLEMLTSIYQQTSRLTSLSPTQSQCGVCHHYQDSSHVAKLQEICESIKIDPKLMMAPPVSDNFEHLNVRLQFSF